MRPQIFIDGREGTTGLQIERRLSQREDLRLLTIDPEKRKDPAERKKLLNAADLVFLCLPDDAAREAVSWIEDPETRVIDASTAHRVAPGWAYGFPELSPLHRRRIAESRRVANPGCHATGFIAAVYPLVAQGLLPADAALHCFSLTGYSGGGKKMIAQYEAADREAALASPGIYGLDQGHKHLPEMQVRCGLETAPVFCPVVDDYRQGMATTVLLHGSQLRGGAGPEDVEAALAAAYAGEPLIRVTGSQGRGKLYGAAYAGTDGLELVVAGNGERITVTALFDNLGKGASGAAVQNMNRMLGLDETTGLTPLPPVR